MFEINNDKNVNKTIRMPEGLTNRLETIATNKGHFFQQTSGLVLQICS